MLHEFWVPKLTRKMTNVPGQPNHIWLQADKPGTYIGQCSEFCGTQHAWMRILVVADEPSKFEEWQRAQLQPGQAATSDATAKGLALVSNIHLHQLSCYPRSSWSGLAGRAGSHACSQPQTTWLPVFWRIRRRTCALWLKSPQHIKPGALMPDFNFTDEQLDQLSEYLSTLR